jgi:RNA polymerase sigma-70 factor (ECF subfamily)
MATVREREGAGRVHAAAPCARPRGVVLPFRLASRGERTVPVPDDRAEAERVARAQAGDRSAFNEIVEAYSARIFTHLLRFVRNREEAEDLAQETFVRAYRALETFDRSRPLRGWLYAIATNVGLNGLRSRRRRIPPAPASPDREGTAPTEPVDPRADAREVAMRNELQERLFALLDRLSPRVAALVQLHYRDGLSLAEAGAMLGMSEGAAKVALHRARRSLREWLIEEETHDV